jgi:hypothetical protein
MLLLLTLFTFYKKGELKCVLEDFKGLLKIKGTGKFFSYSGVTCPNEGPLIDITSKHL